jgi:hypothetical protein
MRDDKLLTLGGRLRQATVRRPHRRHLLPRFIERQIIRPYRALLHRRWAAPHHPRFFSPPSTLHASTQEPSRADARRREITQQYLLGGERELCKSGCRHCWRLYISRMRDAKGALLETT